jgi:response regulator RpfG family c-di-GMP phosphodiesterase
VFLDVNLPGRDGIAVARILSTHAPCPKLIGCSAEAFPSTRDAGLAAGMAAYLVKPANLDAIAAALEPNSATDSISSMTGGGSLFEKIRTPELQARAREELLLSWPASLESMRSFSLRTEELPALQRRAHQIRSTALIAGDPALAETLRRIEEAAALGELAAVRDLLSHSHPSEPTYASVRVPS